MAKDLTTTAELEFKVDTKSIKKAVESANSALKALRQDADVNINIDDAALRKTIKNMESVQQAILVLLAKLANVKKLSIKVELDEDNLVGKIRTAIEDAFKGAMIQANKSMTKGGSSSADPKKVFPVNSNYIKQILNSSIVGSNQRFPKDFYKLSTEDKFLGPSSEVGKYEKANEQLVAAINDLKKTIRSRLIVSAAQRQAIIDDKTQRTGVQDFRFIPEVQNTAIRQDLFDLRNQRKTAISFAREIQEALQDPNITSDVARNLRKSLRDVFVSVAKIDTQTGVAKQELQLTNRLNKAELSYENAFDRAKKTREELETALAGAISSGSNATLNQVLKRYERVSVTLNNALEANRKAQDNLRAQLNSAGIDYQKAAEGFSDLIGTGPNAVGSKALKDILSKRGGKGGLLQNFDAKGVFDSFDPKDIQNAFEGFTISELANEVDRLTKSFNDKKLSDADQQIAARVDEFEKERAAVKRLIDVLGDLLDARTKINDAQRGTQFLDKQEQSLTAIGSTAQSEIRQARSVQRANEESQKVSENAFRRAKRLIPELRSLEGQVVSFANSIDNGFVPFDENIKSSLRSLISAVESRRVQVSKSISDLSIATQEELRKLNQEFAAFELNPVSPESGRFKDKSVDAAKALKNQLEGAIFARQEREIRDVSDAFKEFEVNTGDSVKRLRELEQAASNLKSVKTGFDQINQSLKIANPLLDGLRNRLKGGDFKIDGTLDLENVVDDFTRVNGEIDKAKNRIAQLKAVLKDLNVPTSIAGGDTLAEGANNVIKFKNEVSAVRQELSLLEKSVQDSIKVRFDLQIQESFAKNLQKTLNDAISGSINVGGRAASFGAEFDQVKQQLKTTDSKSILIAADNFRALKSEVDASIKTLSKANDGFDLLRRTTGSLTDEQEIMFNRNKQLISSLQQMAAQQELLTAKVNQQEKTAKAAGKSFGFYSQEIADTITSNLRFANSVAVVSTAMFGLRSAFTEIIEESRGFARLMTVAQSANLDFAKTFEVAMRASRDQAVAFGLEIGKVQEVLKQFGSAGFTLEESLSGLNSTLKLITATSAEAESVSRAVAGIYRVFGKQLRQTYGDFLAFGSIADTLTNIYRNHQVELEEIVNGMKFAGAAAASSGFTFEETGALLAVLNDNLIKSGTAGRSLQVIFAQMANKTKAFSDAFGVALDPTKPLNQQFIGLLKQVNAQLGSGALSVQELEKRFDVFGLRGARAFVTLVEKFDDVEKALFNTQAGARGTANELSEIVRGQLAAKIDRARQSLLDFARIGLEPVAQLAGVVAGAIIKMRNVLVTFPTATKIASSFVVITGILGALIVTLGALSKLFVTSIVLLKEQTKIVIANALSWKAAAAARIEAAAAARANAAATAMETDAQFLAAKNATKLRAILGSIGSALVSPAGLAAIAVGIGVAVAAYFGVFTKLKEGLQETFLTVQDIDDRIAQISAKATENNKQVQRIADFEKQLARLDDALKNTDITAEAFGQQVRDAFVQAGAELVDINQIAIASNLDLASSFKNLKAEAEAYLKVQKDAAATVRATQIGQLLTQESKANTKIVNSPTGDLFGDSFVVAFRQNRKVLEERAKLQKELATLSSKSLTESDIARIDELNKELAKLEKQVGTTATTLRTLQERRANAIGNIQAAGGSPQEIANSIKILTANFKKTIRDQVFNDFTRDNDNGKDLFNEVVLGYIKEGGKLSAENIARVKEIASEGGSLYGRLIEFGFGQSAQAEIASRFDQVREDIANSIFSNLNLDPRTTIQLGVTLPEPVPIDKYAESIDFFEKFRFTFSQPLENSTFKQLNDDYLRLATTMKSNEETLDNAKRTVEDLQTKQGGRASTKDIVGALSSGQDVASLRLSRKAVSEDIAEILTGELRNKRLGLVLKNIKEQAKIDFSLNVNGRTINDAEGIAKILDTSKNSAELLKGLTDQITEQMFTDDQGASFIEDSLGLANINAQGLLSTLGAISDATQGVGSQLRIFDFLGSITSKSNRDAIENPNNGLAALIEKQINAANKAIARKADLNPLQQLFNQRNLVGQKFEVKATYNSLKASLSTAQKLAQELRGVAADDKKRRDEIQKEIDQILTQVELYGDLLLAQKKIAQAQVRATNEIIRSNQATRETAQLLLGVTGLKESELNIQEEIVRAKLKELEVDELLFSGASTLESRATAIAEINKLLQDQIKLRNDLKNGVAEETATLYETVNIAKVALNNNKELFGFQDRQLSRASKLNRIEQQLQEAEALRGTSSVKYQSKVIELRKQQVPLLKAELDDVEKMKKEMKDLGDITDRRVESLKATRKALQDIRKPFEDGLDKILGLDTGLARITDIATASGQDITAALRDPKVAVDRFINSLREGRADLNLLSNDTRQFAQIIQDNFKREEETVRRLQSLQVERFRQTEKALDLARFKKDFKEADKLAGELFKQGQDLFAQSPEQLISFLQRFNKLNEDLLKEREDYVQEVKIRFNVLNSDGAKKQIEVIRDALREAIEQLTSFTDVKDTLEDVIANSLEGKASFRSNEFVQAIDLRLERLTALINRLDGLLVDLESGGGSPRGKDFVKDILGDPSFLGNRFIGIADAILTASASIYKLIGDAAVEANTESAVDAAKNIAKGVVKNAETVAKEIESKAGKSSLLGGMSDGADKTLRDAKEGIQALVEVLSGKDVDYKAIFQARDKAIFDQARKGATIITKFFVDAAENVRNTLLKTFDQILFGGLKKVGEVFFKSFDLGFAIENVQALESYIQQIVQINEDFNTSVIDSQDSLRRNEGDYLDYLNNIQDLEKQRIQQRLDAEKQYREQLKSTTEVFREQLKGSFDSIFSGLEFSLLDIFGGESSISTDIKTLFGAVATSVDLLSIIGKSGQSALNNIDQVDVEDLFSTAEEKKAKAEENVVKAFEDHKETVDAFGKAVEDFNKSVQEFPQQAVAAAVEAAKGYAGGTVAQAKDSVGEAASSATQASNEQGVADKNVLGMFDRIGNEVVGVLSGIIGKVLLSLFDQSVSIVMTLLTTLVSQLIENGGEKVLKFFNKFIKELPKVVVEFTKQFSKYVPELLESFADNLPVVIQALVDAVPVVIDTLVKAIVTQGPQILEGLLSGAVKLIGSIIDGLAKNAGALVEAGTRFTSALLEAIPQLIVAVAEALANNVDAIFIALFKAQLYLLVGLAYDLLKSVINLIPGANLPSFSDAVLSKIPNKFHSGGVIPGNAEDLLIIAQSGEGVLSRDGLRAIGGPKVLDEINAGNNPFADSSQNRLKKFHSGGVVGGSSTYTGGDVKSTTDIARGDENTFNITVNIAEYEDGIFQKIVRDIEKMKKDRKG